MLVKYKVEKSDDKRSEKGIKVSFDELFVVLGYTSRGNITHYLLNTYTFPSYYQEDELEIIDPRKSSFWEVRNTEDAVENYFPEWYEKNFYRNLDNYAPRECHIISSYVDFLIREYPQPFLTMALPWEEKWHICPHCNHIWEIYSSWGLIRCPRCYTKLNNPLYQQDRLRISSEMSFLRVMKQYQNCPFDPVTQTYEKKKRH